MPELRPPGPEQRQHDGRGRHDNDQPADHQLSGTEKVGERAQKNAEQGERQKAQNDQQRDQSG